MAYPYVLGRHVEHDPRSLDFPAETRPALKSVLWGPPPIVLDQGRIGSCTGNATVDVLNCLGHNYDEKVAVAIYTWATHHDGIPGAYPKEDTGSTGLAAAKAAKHFGLLKSYRHAFGTDHTLGALMLQPVMIGIPWYEGMFDPDGDGFLSVTGGVAGGHEIAIIGYDATDKYVTFLNSWGPTWGENGTAKVHVNDLDRLLSEQGDCTVPLI
jgi:hypothetical protein